MHPAIKSKLESVKPRLMQLLEHRKYSEILQILTSTCLEFNMPRHTYDRTMYTPYASDDIDTYRLKQYVNFSVVKHDGKTYIAAAKPKKENIDGFVQLLQQAAIDLIVSCIPDINYTNKFLLLSSKPVMYKNSLLFYDEDYQTHFGVVKILRIARWIDHGVLKSSEMTYFYKHFASIEYRNVLVHCTAGVGRTGVVIAYDILMKYQSVNESILIDMLVDMRACRNGLVYSTKQLEFLVKEFLDKDMLRVNI